ncbi:MAG: hypothetical protein JWP87_3052 [Labilithrix sp.]|nr:hypothetical protein [Labilithrix sp.]
MVLKKLAFGVASSLLVTVVACGGADPSISDFNKSRGPGSGGSGDGNDDGSSGTIGGNGAKPENNDLAACATQSATAEARPVYLVFMFDKSGSMVKNGSPKWASATAASKAFFESQDSKGISASLSYFPDDVQSCNSGDYSTPEVPLTALPSTSFGQNLDNQDPNGGTPTKAALQGAITYAQQVGAGQGKDGKVAVVLVTDGVPEGCGDNSIGNISALAAGVAATIPTYVIGVGDQLTNLNDIAAGGGTKSALIVSVNNPAQIQADFTKAINQIKASALTCDYKIPAAPAGETFDRSKVNVQHTPTGGTAGTLTYNQSCAGGTGWQYDDANNPTRILLCNASCDGVKAKSGKVDILFGCATQTGPVK